MRPDAKQPGTTYRYMAARTENADDIFAAVLTAAPASVVTPYGRLVRQLPDLDHQGGGIWYASVPYELPEGADADRPGGESDSPDMGSEWSFETTGGTTHILLARHRRSVTKLAGVTRTFAGLSIGTQQDRVEGCDITTPRLTYSQTVTFPSLPRSYLLTLRELTGTINRNVFHGFDRGELLFLGASGQHRAEGKWAVTFNWTAEKTYRNLAIAAGLVIELKRGWDYFWVAYRPAVEDGEPYQQAYAAIVDEVYPEGDFEDLGIGV